MSRRLFAAGSVPLCALAVVAWIAAVAAASPVAVPVNFNLPRNDTNKAHLVGAFTSPINETEGAWPHVWGTIPCNEYMTFNSATHAAAVSGIAFSYSNPGTVSVENVTISYGSAFLGATVTTDNLLATIYTPAGTIGPVQPDGYFDNSYHYVELNGGQAHLVGRGLLSSYTYDFNFAAAPISNQAAGAAGPLTVSAAADPHGITIDASGYHVTYDYTTQLTVPMNVTYPISQLVSGINVVGTISVNGNLVTDSFVFSHTFDYPAGDGNLDGTVNGGDLNTVLANYNRTGMQWDQGDFDGNGTVNGGDLNIVLANYNQHVLFATATVPEPGALMLLGSGGTFLLFVGWLRRRRP